MTSKPVRFSLLLPLFSLLVWGQMVATPVIFLFFKLMMSGGATHGVDNGVATHRLSYVLFSALRFGVPTDEYFFTALDLPGLVIDLLVDVATTFPESWHPALLSIFQWRAVSYPFYSLPFWWFAGVGIDGLMHKRNLRWFLVLPGTILSVALLVGLFGETFGLPPEDRKGIMYFSMIFGTFVWAVMFATFPAAWIRNRKFEAVP